MTGLSPRVRGNPPIAEWVYPRVCGGTERVSLTRSTGARVYPRVCGGTSPGLRGCVQGDFMRVYPRVCGGTQHDRGQPSVSIGTNGSIPACAGEPSTCTMVRAYPRVCGGTTRPERFAGLSPRVRGNPAVIRYTYPRVRGNPYHSQVYPRVCGGTRGARFNSPNCGSEVAGEPVQSLGLSPRVRGNPVGIPWGGVRDTR